MDDIRERQDIYRVVNRYGLAVAGPYFTEAEANLRAGDDLFVETTVIDLLPWERV